MFISFCVIRVKILVLIICWVAKTDAIFKLTKVDILIREPTIVRLDYCRLKAVRRDVAELSVRVQLLQTVHDVEVGIEYLKYLNGYKPFLFNKTIDGCWFMRAFTRNKDVGFVTLLYNIISKYTNVNHTCPFEGAIIMEKFYPQHTDLAHLPWPTGDYMIRASFRVQKKLIVDVHIGFMFTEVEKFGRRNNGARSTSQKPKKT